ncbi:MAG: cell division protein FtsA [Minisyncoccia bacterium]
MEKIKIVTMPSHILVLDLGTNNIKVLVAQYTNDNWQIVFPALKKSQGVKQGMVENVETVANNLDDLFDEISSVNKNFLFKEAVVGLNGPHLETRISKGVSVISRPDGEISEDDKERALRTAQSCVLPNNRTLVQTTVKNYIIDGNYKVKDPSGMKGLRLEVECLLIDAFSMAMRNLNRVSDTLGMKFNYIITPYAGAEWSLSNQDKDLGAVAIDLGGGTTGMCVYEEGELIDLKVFPVGGNNITNDIAVGLKTYVDIAEKIKLKEGIALAKKVSKGATINLKDIIENIEENEDLNFSKKFVAEIIEARLTEIFDLVGERLKELNRFGKLPGGVILFGGGALMPYIIDLAKDRLKLPVRIAKTENNWYQDQLDSSFVPSLGLLSLTVKNYNTPQLGINFFEKIKDLFNL